MKCSPYKLITGIVWSSIYLLKYEEYSWLFPCIQEKEKVYFRLKDFTTLAKYFIQNYSYFLPTQNEYGDRHYTQIEKPLVRIVIILWCRVITSERSLSCMSVMLRLLNVHMFCYNRIVCNILSTLFTHICTTRSHISNSLAFK